MPAIHHVRRPRASPLWQIVHHAWDDFLASYEKHHRRAMGPLRPDAVASVRAFLRCGDLAAGFTRFHCPECGHEKLLAFTCKSRHFVPENAVHVASRRQFRANTPHATSPSRPRARFCRPVAHPRFFCREHSCRTCVPRVRGIRHRTHRPRRTRLWAARIRARCHLPGHARLRRPSRWRGDDRDARRRALRHVADRRGAFRHHARLFVAPCGLRPRLRLGRKGFAHREAAALRLLASGELEVVGPWFRHARHRHGFLLGHLRRPHPLGPRSRWISVDEDAGFCGGRLRQHRRRRHECLRRDRFHLDPE
ncbi:MAG: transposase zinc-binding domain-containing protein [Burkholderiales bacterium]|nr:transposase zinc-binding domain-containing protein [Opitutaceae bacterium]